MTYQTIMLHMDVGSNNESTLAVAKTLAARFHAHVIGIAACQPVEMMQSDGYVSGDIIAMNVAEIATETVEAEHRFRTALEDNCAALSWRSVTNHVELADYIVREARAADLLITGPDTGWSAFDASRRTVVSDLVLRAGRPVLIVPHTQIDMDLENVVIGWKETRESRRAIADALPLLKKATYVTIVAIMAKEEALNVTRDHLSDVSQWLDRHDIRADVLSVVSSGDDAAQLQAIAKAKSAGVVVAGAYGHNRLQEWIFGGVTRDLLTQSNFCSLVSH